jgi:hypothetical protein
MRRILILSVLGALSMPGGAVLTSPASAQPARVWEIGPITPRRRNYSVGMPLTPAPAGSGWYFDFPYPHDAAGHVHYVTFQPGPLIGKSKIVVRYRVDTAWGAGFVARGTPGQPATVSLYLQRQGDNWSGRGPYEYFRWYAPGPSVQEITPGVHEMTVSLNGWTSVNGRPNIAAFRDALVATDRVGLVFGSSSARGHGVYATAPARFTLISFRVL